MNSTTYKWEESRGYIILEVDGQKALVDTGAKDCVGLTPFKLLGKTYPNYPVYGGMTAADISRSVGRDDVSHLIGLDILGEMPWAVDWKAKTFTFNPEVKQGEVIPLIKDKFFGDIWKLDVNFRLDGRTIQAVFDTGAPLSYMPRSEGTGPAKGTYEDFHPMVGEYVTTMFERKIDFGKCKAFPVDFGIPPKHLPIDVWVLGTAVIRDRVATFDIPDQKLYLN